MADSISKTAHARQLAGIRMRAEHAALCCGAGKTVARAELDDGDRPY